ncbi:MAG: helix-turn-helix domain-containing protein [Nitrospinaceae bacterium]|jgi:putative transposase|nr:helix-turn-helix domain-containing protein [Nitrospinaceae bacterium]|tara:strand:+ start:98 stop:649 length:552 start_codon:yes stop_codon:yes gene_type:complete
MPGFYKKASPLPVSQRQRQILEQMVRRSKSQQQHVKRAQIILMGSEGFGNQQIADELDVDRKTVYHWRERWLSQTDPLLKIEAEVDDSALSKAILSTLSDGPRSGAPVTYTAEMVCQMIAVSCEDPLKCDHPISHWTPQALRLEVIDRQIVEDISVRQIGRFLKGGRSKAFSSAVLGTSPGCG